MQNLTRLKNQTLLSIFGRNYHKKEASYERHETGIQQTVISAGIFQILNISNLVMKIIGNHQGLRRARG